MLSALVKVRRDLNQLAGVIALTLDAAKDNYVFHGLNLVKNLQSHQEIQWLTVHIAKFSMKASWLKRDKQEDIFRQSLLQHYQHLIRRESFRNLGETVVSYY